MTSRAPTTTARRGAWRTRPARFIVHRLLGRLAFGEVVLVEGEREQRFGARGPVVRVVIHDARTFEAVLRGGSTALGSSHADGWWDCEELTTLVQVLARGRAPWRRRADRLARRRASLTPFRARSRSDRTKDRANVRAHYDLSNEFFELMLDESMMYSCAFFESPSSTLAEASLTKLDRLCRKLDLGPDDHVVEIGTGWGGFALHAAKTYGSRVTTTTISDAQFEYASRRVLEAGLSDRVTVLNLDYRDLTGTFDKLVSIEMIEAIGWREMDTFFSTCANLIKSDGVMGLQAIVIDDRSYDRAKSHEDFIKSFIFPGGFLPSIEAMVSSMASTSDLRVVDLEDIGRHYVETLRHWRANLERYHDQVDALGLGEHFHRLWRMYLCYCEGAFLERHVSDVQMILARDEWRAALGPLATRGS